MRKMPDYQHIVRDYSGRVLGTAFVYDDLPTEQRREISATCPQAAIRPYGGKRTEVFLPSPST